MWSSPLWQGQPEADFYAEETTLPVGCDVDFFDQSLGVPTSWEWTFEGGTPETSTDKNPAGIVYEEEGTYDVSLTVTNSQGTDTYTWSDYMTVSEGIAPNVHFTASDSIVCTGSVITFQDASSNCPTGWEWVFEPSTVVFVNGTNMYDESPQVAFAELGTYNVSLTVSNNAGNNVLTKEEYIHIGVIPLPFNDDFEGGSLASRSWSVENPDFNITWDVATVGGIEPGDKAAVMNFFDYLVPPGGRDRLISPVLDMTGYDEVLLSFRHAYAKQHSSVTDSLIVKISSDCGETWTRIFEGGEDGDGSFATHELMTTPFVPEVQEDWCGYGWGAGCVVLDISSWAGDENVKIMFETYNFFGNNLYIDNVMVGPMTDVVENNRPDEVAVFPNPTSGEVNIVLPAKAQNAVVVIYNNQGQELIRMEDDNTGLLKADLSNHGTGIYFLRVESNGASTMKKVVLER
jgi:PKD repeat protein